VNRNRVIGVPYAADHETIECIVAVMRCTKGASVNKPSQQVNDGGRFVAGNTPDSEADGTGERER
jgi:hypothetical protein